MGLKEDVSILKNLIRPPKAKGLHDAIEKFYDNQAQNYDDFRQRLLSGRAPMIHQVNWNEVETWVDLGAGTGQNLEYVPFPEKLKKIYLVDLSKSLLEVAQKRIDRLQLDNVEIVRGDVCQFQLKDKVDLVTFSYSLTMIPNWFNAVEAAHQLLKNGGRIAVVDFFVSRKWADLGSAQHGFFTRVFWPLWFAHDNVFLNPDHVPYLKNRFQVEKYLEATSKIPYIPPFWKVPYYTLIAKKAHPS